MKASTQQIWERFSSELRGYLARRVNDAEIADDLLQDVFVRVHTGLDGLQDEERVAPWVFRIARNAVIDHYRRRRPERAGDADAAAGNGDDDVMLQPAADREDDPEVAAARERIGGFVAGLIAQLPDTYREAVRLAELEGLTQAEVAQRLGLSLSGAKSRVQRGRALLREQVLECCHFEFDQRQRVIGFEPRPASCCTCRDHC